MGSVFILKNIERLGIIHVNRERGGNSIKNISNPHVIAVKYLLTWNTRIAFYALEPSFICNLIYLTKFVIQGRVSVVSRSGVE